MKTYIATAACAAACLAAQPASAATNVIPAHWTTIFYSSAAGILRPGSPWGPGSTPSNALTPADGVFAPESQQWNNGSYWWDAQASDAAASARWEVWLDGNYTFNQLKVQADNNDTYLVEYWDGSNWQGVYNLPAVCCFGLTTRDSGILSPFNTNRFRFSATGGDGYYSLSEFQAYAVPEPATWALLILGMGVVGGAMRRRTQVRHAFA